MGVLGEYHRVMGQLILAHEGTLERFAGDGLMIFFNDPIRLENPAANAVKARVAWALRPPIPVLTLCRGNRRRSDE